MHTQKKWCRQVIRDKGDYLLIAKNNQSTLHEDLALYLEDPEADRTCWHTASTCNKGHGRLEKRTLVATTDLNDAPLTRLAGGGASLSSGASGAQKRRLVHHRCLWPHKLPPKRASAEQLLGLNRGHWGIENRLHWRRDVTLGEDHSQVRKGEAPRVLAVLNSFLLALMDFLEVSNVPKQMRIFDA